MSVYHLERCTVGELLKQMYYYKKYETRLIKDYFSGELIITFFNRLLFRKKILLCTIRVDRVILLSILMSSCLLPLYFGKLFFVVTLVLLSYIAYRVLRVFLSGGDSSKYSLGESIKVLSYYAAKQMGDIVGRIAGSVKYGIINL